MSPVPLLGQRHTGRGGGHCRTCKGMVRPKNPHVRCTGSGAEKQRGKEPAVCRAGWAFPGLWIPCSTLTSTPLPTDLNPQRQVPRWPSSTEQPGKVTYLRDLPVGHKGGQGLAHVPPLLRAQVLRGHLDAHLTRRAGRGVTRGDAELTTQGPTAQWHRKSHPRPGLWYFCITYWV